MKSRTARVAGLLAVASLIAAAPAPAARPPKPTPTPTPSPTPTPTPSPTGIPSSMSSIGDSITRGFNACGWFVDCPTRSWSTGSYAPINSHYNRILAKNPAISGRNFNNAVTGADSADLDGQVGAALGNSPEYITILMGANDACTSSESTMTAVATFGSRYSAALNRVSGALPSTRILATSVPDIKRLWFIGKDSSSARSAWSAGSICQSMLANPTSTAQVDVDRRNRVQQRVIDFNAQIAAACSVTPNCRFDNNAVFNYPFVLSQVSGWDYFHPNESGQTVLADVSYRAGFNW